MACTLSVPCNFLIPNPSALLTVPRSTNGSQGFTSADLVLDKTLQGGKCFLGASEHETLPQRKLSTSSIASLCAEVAICFIYLSKGSVC
jgi:hypothetical protein